MRIERWARAIGAFVLALVLAAPRLALAHAVGVSRGEWSLSGARVTGELAFARAELALSFPALDTNHDGTLDDAELASDGEALTREVIGGFALAADGAPCAGSLVDARTAENDGAIVRAAWSCPRAPARLALDATILASLSQGHRLIARVRVGAGAPVEALLYASHAHVEIDVSAAQGAAPTSSPSPAPSAFGFIRMGVEHILTGYDHLLFLFGLVLVGGRIRSIVGVVTAFTVAHSITLGVAVLGAWTPPPRIIEPAIALSIAYVGAENFFIRDAARRWRITFPFGLIHGFGFAGALREIELPRAEVPVALVGFNLGVELGQLAVLAVVLPVLALARAKGWLGSRGVRAMSGAIVAIGLVWFVARVAG